MEKLLNEFEDYCQTPGITSGKASSYSRAIQYLCDFLDIKTIDGNVIANMKQIEPYLSQPDCVFYGDLLGFLDLRGQSSYLKKGFIKAALNHFFAFWIKR